MTKITHFFRLAAIVSTLPNTITNGSAIDAVPVMADMNHIVDQVNANAAPLSNTALLDTANVFTAKQTGIAATAGTHFPIASQIQNSVFLTLTSTLGTNTITARCAALTLTALANGQIFTFVPSQTNTGPVDLNPDGIGNTRILMMGTNVVSGNIIKDVPLAVRYQNPYFHATNAIGTMATQNASAVALTGPLTISNASAGQIVFPAVQNASGDANTLDDYEEGDWTPAFSFTTAGDLSIAYSTQAGRYVKIGKLVTLYFSIVTSTFTHTTAAGNSQITGAPFTAEIKTGMTNIGTLQWGGITLANYTQFLPSIATNSNVIAIEASGSGQGTGAAGTTAFPTGGTVTLRGSVSFMAAA